MDVELKLLRSFAAIYERGSISRAAGHLSCTRAALRITLQEQEIGGLWNQRQTAKGPELKVLGPPALQNEIRRDECHRARKDNLHVGYAIAVAVGLDDGLHAAVEVAQLAGRTEGSIADEDEGIVHPAGDCIDSGDIDEVALSLAEIVDHVTAGGRH